MTMLKAQSYQDQNKMNGENQGSGFSVPGKGLGNQRGCGSEMK